MSWTDERVESLKKLWTEGLSASQIAKQLGGVTRNAVIGKVHRLGLAGRATPSRPAVKRPMRAAAPRPLPSTPAAQPRLRLAGLPSAAATPLEPGSNVVRFTPLEAMRQDDGSVASVLTLTERMCKWPIGDPSDATFGFCGRSACAGPYCSDHARLAYQPQAQKKRRSEDGGDLRRYLRAG
jgi:GcrA cell cycle regulator